jgi:hypothetical protein
MDLSGLRLPAEFSRCFSYCKAFGCHGLQSLVWMIDIPCQCPFLVRDIYDLDGSSDGSDVPSSQHTGVQVVIPVHSSASSTCI